jgi:hypothetical protein
MMLMMMMMMMMMIVMMMPMTLSLGSSESLELSSIFHPSQPPSSPPFSA